MKKVLPLICAIILVSAIVTFAGGQKADTTQAAGKQLKVGMECTYPPFNYRDSSGNLAGFEVELSEEIGKRMNREIVFICQEWDGLLPGLLAGKYDVIISTMSVTPERQKKVDFSIPYRASTGRFVAPKGANIKPYNADGTPNPGALKGKSVGVQRATTHANYLDAMFPGIKIVRYDQIENLILDFQAGRVDLVFHGPIKMSANFLELPEGKDYEFIGKEIESIEHFGTGCGIAIRKGNEELLEELNNTLESIMADGTFEKLNKKYWNFSILPSAWTVAD